MISSINVNKIFCTRFNQGVPDTLFGHLGLSFNILLYILNKISSSERILKRFKRREKALPKIKN